MVSEVKVVKLEERHALAMSATTKVSDIGPEFGRMLAAVTTYMQSANIPAASPAFTRYLTWNTDQTTDMEVGFFVSAPQKGDGEVKPVVFDAGEAAMVTHTGPYPKLGDAYAALGAWVKSNKRETAGPSWELYLNSPLTEPDPEKLRTEVYWPVK